MENIGCKNKLTQRSLKDAELNVINKILKQGLEQGTTKPFWKYTKSPKQDNAGVSPLKRDGKLVTSSTDKANILNQQFKSVFTIDSNNELSPLNYNR